MEDFLEAIGLDNTDIKEKFAKEHVTLDLLNTMNYDHLDKIGITAFGHQHKLLTEANFPDDILRQVMGFAQCCFRS